MHSGVLVLVSSETMIFRLRLNQGSKPLSCCVCWLPPQVGREPFLLTADTEGEMMMIENAVE